MELLDDGKFREQMVTFAVEDESVIEPEHRVRLIPVVVRAVYGRMLSRSSGRSAKDSPASRRNAIMAFVARLSSENEIGHFVYMMVRPFIPATDGGIEGNLDPTRALVAVDSGSSRARAAAAGSSGDIRAVVNMVQKLRVGDMQDIAAAKLSGFIKLLRFDLLCPHRPLL